MWLSIPYSSGKVVFIKAIFAENIQTLIYRAGEQTKQGNRTTGHDQEGRRALNEVVPGTSVLPLRETGVLGDFWGRIKGAKYRFPFQDGTWDIF